MIRVGSGGVMLPNHAPLVVAEQFGMLAAIYPNRIDLGLGRAPGGDFHTMRALRRDHRQTGDDFPASLAELRAYLDDAREGQAVKAIPGREATCPSRCWARARSARNWPRPRDCPLRSPHTLRRKYSCTRRRDSIGGVFVQRRLQATAFDGGRAGNRRRIRCGRRAACSRRPSKDSCGHPY